MGGDLPDRARLRLAAALADVEHFLRPHLVPRIDPGLIHDLVRAHETDLRILGFVDGGVVGRGVGTNAIRIEIGVEYRHRLLLLMHVPGKGIRQTRRRGVLGLTLIRELPGHEPPGRRCNGQRRQQQQQQQGRCKQNERKRDPALTAFPHPPPHKTLGLVHWTHLHCSVRKPH